MSDVDRPPTKITPGQRVYVRDASGDWHGAVAVSGVEPTHVRGRRVHDFPVVLVRFSAASEPVPWPVADVRVRGQHSQARCVGTETLGGDA